MRSWPFSRNAVNVRRAWSSTDGSATAATTMMPRTVFSSMKACTATEPRTGTITVCRAYAETGKAS